MEYLKSGIVIGGRYRVEDLCGEGGMAAVYRVRHAQLDTLHALKVLTMSSKSVQRRLMQEGRVQAAINHPNILSVTDVVDVDGAPGLVMEFIRGPALDDFLEKKRLTAKQMDAIVVPILDGVSAAHGLGLIHRDLKPANVMLAITPHGLLPKVADFGLVKLLADGEDAQFSKTRSGMAMGTPAYMAPEQIRDAKNVDARADIWSIGAILYEICSGKRAFDDEGDLLQMFNAVAGGEFKPIREVVEDLPERMYEAIEAAMTVDRDARVKSVAELKKIWLGEDLVADDSFDDLLSAAQSMGGDSEETSEFLKRSFRSQAGYRPPAAPDAPTALNEAAGAETFYPSTPGHKTAGTIDPGVIGAGSAETLAPVAHPDARTLIESPATSPAERRRRMGMALVGIGVIGALLLPVVGYVAYTNLVTVPTEEEVVKATDVPEPNVEQDAGKEEAGPSKETAPSEVAKETIKRPVDREMVPDKPAPVQAEPVAAVVVPEPSGTADPEPTEVEVPEVKPEPVPEPEPEGTADPGPKVTIDSDVSVFFVDSSGRRADHQNLTAGTYTVFAVYDAGKPDEHTEIKKITVDSGDAVAIKCVGSARRCKVTP